MSSVKDWALEMHAMDAAVLDTEATGLSFQDEVIEVSVVRAIDGSVLFDSLFYPQMKINWHASLKNGLFKKHLKGAPRFFEKWDELHYVLKDRPVIAYNSAFDKRIINQSCTRYDILKPDLNWHCLMSKFKEHVGFKTNQTDACEMLNVKAGTHRALDDALAAARILWMLAHR